MDDDFILPLVILLGGLAVIWWLNKPATATVPTGAAMPNFCGQQLGSISGVPICTTQLSAGSHILTSINQAINPWADSPPSIEGCPFGTRDEKTQVMRRTKEEVAACKEWLNNCKKRCVMIGGFGMSQRSGDWEYGKQPGTCLQSEMVCNPPAIPGKGWRG